MPTLVMSVLVTRPILRARSEPLQKSALVCVGRGRPRACAWTGIAPDRTTPHDNSAKGWSTLHLDAVTGYSTRMMRVQLLAKFPSVSSGVIWRDLSFLMYPTIVPEG